MNFLVHQIREQALLEMETNLDAFIEDKKISDQAIIYRMVFSKDAFEKEVEVREYLKDKYFFNFDIREEGNNFLVSLVSESQVDDETKVEVEVRRGLTIFAADLMPIMAVQEISFNNKGEFNLAVDAGSINLNSKLPHIIEIARVAEGDHPSYGKISITKETLAAFKENFKSKVTGVDLAINEDHLKNEAFGWFKDVFLSFDETVCYAQIVWNSKGTQALSEKEYRYFSPEFRFNYVHPHTGKEHGPTLLGGALTNYPFLKMDAITELNSKQKTTEVKKMSKDTQIDLSVHNEKIVELSEKISKANAALETEKEKNIELSSKNEKLEAELNKKNKEAANQKLFDSGKINAAQLIALNEGKGLLEVLSLSEKMIKETKGVDTNTDKVVNLSESEKKIAKGLGLTDEEFAASN